MTLGGLALAVGILVDDATVEIENVHRNLAMKKPLRRAILDGAAQIAVPAFVSTLAICIVFVPVVFLTGPAAYLFIPLALAVVFAMMASYLLSRTLVPTMVLYLLKAEAEQYAQRPVTTPPAGVFGRLHARVRARASRRCGRRTADCSAWALAHRGWHRRRHARVRRRRRSRCSRCIGRDFFPAVDAGQIRLHVRAPAGNADRGDGAALRPGRGRDPRDGARQSERDMILDNMGVSPFYTNTAYISNELGQRRRRRDPRRRSKPDHRPTADYVRRLREELPRRFPGCTFYFQPADITGQMLTFGMPAPINVQVVGVRREENLAVAKKLRGPDSPRSRASSTSACGRSPTPRSCGWTWTACWRREPELTQQDAARSLLVSLSSSYQATPNFWVNPKNGVNYRVAVQTPQAQIDSRRRAARARR